MDLGLDTTPAALAAAPAQRVPRPGWRDPRLWVGVALVAVSVVAGAKLLASADDTVPVWTASTDLAPGAPLSAADLEQHRVRFADADEAGGYFAGTAPPEGVLIRGVAAGELVPRAAVGDARASGTVQVPLAVDPEQVPPSVGPGSVVDVYVLGAAGGRGSGAEPVLGAVSVVDAPAVADSLVTSGKRQLVLAVPEDDAHRFFGTVGAVDSPTLTVVRRS